jgi:pentatricopeptide repeat-containing protein PET309
MLQSGVWHHGPNNSSLQVPAATFSISANTSADVDNGAASNPPCSGPKTSDGVLLDFLYPEKTLALLKNLSTNSHTTAHPRRRPLQATRHFATLKQQTLSDGGSMDMDVVEQAKREAARLVERSDAVKELKAILGSPGPEKQEVAWQLYSSIPEDQLAAQDELRCSLLEFLVRDGEPAEPGRVLQIFSELSPAVRRLSSYRAAVVAYIALRMVGPAIKLLEDIDPSNDFDMLRLGTDAILRRTVSDEQWDLTFRVFRMFRRQTPRLHGKPLYMAIRHGNTLPELWRGVAQLPELLEHFQSFLRYVQEFRHELTASPELKRDLDCFVMSFVPHVMDRVLNTRKPDEYFIWDFFVKLFDDLHSLNLPTSACYEYAIKRMLELPRYQKYTNQRKIWLELYRRYRSRYVDTPNAPLDWKPSQNLIRNLIHQHSLMEGWQRVHEHINDLRTFYPGRPLRPGLLKHLIQAYASAGDADKVHESIDELQRNYKDEINIEILSALPYVYARRADVDGTIKQFNRIHAEYHMIPDIACWNILLLAYLRADDLDGALECFNNCINYGLVPDVMTFGPLLDFCAQRGDIEAFETLFSRAKQMGVQLDADVRARSGYVHAFLNAGDPEGADAIAGGMLNSWNAGTLYGHPLTHTWNLLIQHYALNKDLAGSRRRYKQMVDNNIPLDSWTYGSLMRALIEVKQTNAAYKLLRVTMPEQGIRVHALHYAIVITGFLREGQVEQAIGAYDRMMQRKVPQTESSHAASIRALGAANLQKLEKRGAKHPNYRLLVVEEALEKMLASSMSQEIAHRQPTQERLINSRNYGAVPQSYLGLMIGLYNARSAYKICQKLFEKAQASAPDYEGYTQPLTLTTAMMETHLKAGNHEEVAKFWELARSSATKLTKTFSQAAEQPVAAPEADSLLDPLVQQRFQESQISKNRRHILVNPTRLFIRSLMAQSDSNAMQEAQRTIINLLVNGFTVDTFTWNEFVQQLALRNQLADAFAICEEYLMPRFPGWRDLYPGYQRKNIEGYQWMEVRPYDVKRNSVLPRYKTLVLLGKAYGQTKRDEANGIGYDADAQMWMREILERDAPMTIRAIETMPRTYDRLQEIHFGNVL